MANTALVAGHVLGEDHELVAAEAGDGVVGAHDRAEPLGEADEQLVAGAVAEAVVDDLEPVEVEEEDRHLLLQLPGPDQRVLEPVEHEGAVRQAGEVVVHAPGGRGGSRPRSARGRSRGAGRRRRPWPARGRRARRGRGGTPRSCRAARPSGRSSTGSDHVEPQPGFGEGGPHRRHERVGAGVGDDHRLAGAQRLAVDVRAVDHAHAEVLQHAGGQVAAAPGDQPLALDEEHPDDAVADEVGDHGRDGEQRLVERRAAGDQLEHPGLRARAASSTGGTR